jgi:predicted HicB family RNase H-like nuclease
VGTAQTRAQNKYINKVYDRVNLVVDKGEKDKIKAHAEKQGESLNGFINRAISETIERDNAKTKTE